MADKKPRVSLCMIVRDEEQNLAECLNPVAELFDEIVIVDTGSQDRTKEIAARFTPHVHDFPWCDDFSAARNESLGHATGEWIFWLDADDRIRPQHVERLRRLIAQLNDTAQLDDRPRIFMMDTMLPSADSEVDQHFVTHLRLFRRHPDLHWEGRVHEQLAPEPKTLGYEFLFTDIQIEHVGYLNAGLAGRKERRKLRLLRMDYAVDPDRPSTLFHLAMSLHRSGSKDARAMLLRLVASGWDSDLMLLVYDALASAALKNGNFKEAIRFVEQGLARFPDDERLLFTLASVGYEQQDYSAAAQALERIMRSPPQRRMLFGAIANVKTRLAPCMLGAVQRAQGAYAHAEATLQGVLQAFPADRAAWFNLGLIYLDQGRDGELARLIQRVLTLPLGIKNASLLAALWHLRHGDPAKAMPIIDDLIARWPYLPRPRMLRAECLSRCHAPLEQQIRALRDVLRVSPSDTETQCWLALAQRAQQTPRQPAPSHTPWGSLLVMPGAAIA